MDQVKKTQRTNQKVFFPLKTFYLWIVLSCDGVSYLKDLSITVTDLLQTVSNKHSLIDFVNKQPTF